MRKSVLGFLLCVGSMTMSAQTENYLEQQTIYGTKVEEQSVVSSNHQVITNFWSDNWFVLGNAGINAFWGDYGIGNLTTRLTPQFNIGVGKWFVPGFGAKLQFTGFSSKENKSVDVNYLNDKTYYDSDDYPYWNKTIKWCDLNFNMMFNLSRLIKGYEGIGSPKMMNQFIASVGIGATHHMGLPKGYSSNHFSGFLELQYSHFFSEKKNFSLDATLRGILYSTEFDLIRDQYLDENVSLNVGLTYYFKERGWKRTVANTTYYVADLKTINELHAEIARLKNAKTPVDTVYVEDQTVINQLQEEINRLKNAQIPVNAIGVNQSNLITFPYLVNFVIDKVEVVNRERVNLKVVAEMIKATPDQKYLICGYADKYTGTVARNIWLAEHRSKNVYKILTEEFGVPASQLVLDDKGGVDNMYYDDPQLSRSAIISKYEE